MEQGQENLLSLRATSEWWAGPGAKMGGATGVNFILHTIYTPLSILNPGKQEANLCNPPPARQGIHHSVGKAEGRCLPIHPTAAVTDFPLALLCSREGAIRFLRLHGPSSISPPPDAERWPLLNEAATHGLRQSMQPGPSRAAPSPFCSPSDLCSQTVSQMSKSCP